MNMNVRRILVVAGFVAITSCAVAQSIPDIIWTTNAHGYGVISVSFSGDSAALASGSSDRTVQVRTTTNAQLIRLFGNPQGGVLSVALSLDGSFVVIGDGGGVIQMRSILTGSRLWASSPHDELINSIAVSSDGTQVVEGRAFYNSRDNGRVVLHRSIDGEGRLFQGHQGGVNSVAFSPDAAIVASASSDGTARLWRESDGMTLHILTGHSFFNPTNEDETVIHTVTSVDFSPDGTLLASAGMDGTARLWNVSDGAEMRVLSGGGGNAAKFSPDGKLLFTVSAGAIRVWRVADGQLLHTYASAGAGPLAVASNGKYFAYGRADGAVVLAHMPMVVEHFRQGNQIILRWTGGSGLYRIQRRNNLARGKWHNFGPRTTAMSYTNKITREPVFYRVVSLPNP